MLVLGLMFTLIITFLSLASKISVKNKVLKSAMQLNEEYVLGSGKSVVNTSS